MGTEQSNIQSPHKKARRQQYVKQAITLIKQARYSVDRAIRFSNFEIIDDLVTQSALVFRNVLQSIFRQQIEKHKQNWERHNLSLAQMEEQLQVELQNISEVMPIWQTRPLKTKIDLIKTSASSIKFAAERATPEINLNENKLKQLFEKSLDVKFFSSSFLNKNQNTHNNERNKLSVGTKIKSTLSTIFSSPTKKSRQTLNINKTNQEYTFDEGEVDRFQIPQLAASHSLSKMNKQRANKNFSSPNNVPKGNDKKRDFKANRYFVESYEHIQQRKSMSKPRCISLDQIRQQNQSPRPASLSQSPNKK